MNETERSTTKTFGGISVMLGGIETNLESKTKQKSGIRAEKKKLSQVYIGEAVQSVSYYCIRFI